MTEAYVRFNYSKQVTRMTKVRIYHGNPDSTKYRILVFFKVVNLAKIKIMRRSLTIILSQKSVYDMRNQNINSNNKIYLIQPFKK